VYVVLNRRYKDTEALLQQLSSHQFIFTIWLSCYSRLHDAYRINDANAVAGCSHVGTSVLLRNAVSRNRGRRAAVRDAPRPAGQEFDGQLDVRHGHRR